MSEPIPEFGDVVEVEGESGKWIVTFADDTYTVASVSRLSSCITRLPAKRLRVVEKASYTRAFRMPHKYGAVVTGVDPDTGSRRYFWRADIDPLGAPWVESNGQRVFDDALLHLNNVRVEFPGVDL